MTYTSRIEKAAIAWVAHKQALNGIRAKIQLCDTKAWDHDKRDFFRPEQGGVCGAALAPHDDDDMLDPGTPEWWRFVHDAWCQPCQDSAQALLDLRAERKRSGGLASSLIRAVNAAKDTP